MTRAFWMTLADEAAVPTVIALYDGHTLYIGRIVYGPVGMSRHRHSVAKPYDPLRRTAVRHVPRGRSGGECRPSRHQRPAAAARRGVDVEIN
jgi:hypothetical protein